MAIQDDFSVASSGDIRYTGTTANYTVIAFHRWLGDLMDDAQATGNDILDITDATASERSTDNIITLNSPYNIDDVAARHLYDGSIIQGGASTTIYDGIVVFAPAGIYLDVLQNGQIVSPNFWGTGLNADAANGISHRFVVKVRVAGTDTDGRRLIGMTREFSKTYSEFTINGTARGNNVMALSQATDLNNETAEATVKTWITISNAEGYRLIDVNNDAATEPYYSEWNRDTYTINQLFERTKWLSMRAKQEDSNADIGSDFTVDNATILGQAQSFQTGVNAMYLTRVVIQLKKTGSPTGNLTAKLYAITGAFGGGDDAPTGAALATSVNIDTSKLTTIYAETEIGFTTQYKMAASTGYALAIEHPDGTAANYVQIRGLATTGTHAGNRAQNTGTWGAVAADDLWFSVRASAELYEMAGERFRGITHEVVVDTPTGTFQPVEPISWSGGTGQMLAINSTTAPTKLWMQLLTGVAPTDNQTITGGQSTATCLMNVTITARSLSFPYLGTSTGSALIGAYGVGIEVLDLSASDKLFDLDNTQRIPPNNVTFTVSGLIATEDRVLVGPAAAGVLDEDQMTLATTLSGATETAVVVTAAIPSDSPSSGTIRIQLNSGIYRRVAYTSFTGSTFTIAPTNFTADPATQPKNVFISYLDLTATATSHNFIYVYNSDRTHFIRVRDGGSTPIKTFEGTATMGSAGGSITAIRTSDA